MSETFLSLKLGVRGTFWPANIPSYRGSQAEGVCGAWKATCMKKGCSSGVLTWANCMAFSATCSSVTSPVVETLAAATGSDVTVGVPRSSHPGGAAPEKPFMYLPKCPV